MASIGKIWLALAAAILLSAIASRGPSAAVLPPGSIENAPSIPGEFLVKFKPDTERSRITLQSRAAALQGRVAKTFRRSGWQLLRLPRDMTARAGLAYLRSFPEVAWAEPNYRIELCNAANDYDSDKLWGLEKIGAPLAWKDSTGGSNVVVAILDSGIDYTHPDLASNVWRNPGEIPGNGRDDDRNGYVDDVFGIDVRDSDSDPMDDAGHGTHVAGTVGAVGGNGAGVVGVNWSVRLMALRMFSADGASAGTDAAVEAYEYAIAMKQRGVNVRVINNSWLGRSPSAALREGIGVAAQEGILSVCAAGNDYQNNDWIPAYPAGYDWDAIIAVAASNQRDVPASFSNVGLRTVHLAAPGVGTLSTYRGGPYYADFSGTSMAAPHVSGAAALLLSRRPTLTVAELKALLLTTVDRFPAWEGKLASGGRLNLGKAMQKLAVLKPSDSPQSVPDATVAPPQLAAPTAAYQRMTAVSRNRRGQLGNSSSAFSSISADGRFIAFSSDATDLVENDTNERTDVFLLDRQQGSLERISVSISGEEAKEDCGPPAISADGRYVVFASTANNLVPGDRNKGKDIFLFDRVSRLIELVSVRGMATPANGDNDSPSVSADGRYVAFASDASNLAQGDVNFVRDIFVRDRLEQVTTPITGAFADDESDSPSISADGRFIAFQSLASNLIRTDTNEASDVFVFDRDAQTFERVSVTPGGAEANSGSAFPAINSNGRYVTFQSYANNLGPPDANFSLDIFLRDRQTAQTRRISRSNTGAEPDSDCTNPALSADGRFVVFESDALRLNPGDTKAVYGIFLYDLLTSKLARVNFSDFGYTAGAGSLSPKVSGDGRFITFTSLAFNMVPADGNAAFDVFLLDRGPAPPDLMIRVPGRTAPFTGRGIFGVTPSQRLEQTIAVNQTAAYELLLENSGQEPDAFLISAKGPPPGWTAEFYDSASGGAAITASVLGASWTTQVVEPGKSLTLRLEVLPVSRNDGERKASIVVKARSLRTASPEDAVQAVTLLPFTPPDLNLASRSANGAPGDGGSDFASVTSDGSLVAFASDASNLISGDSNDVSDIFVFDVRSQRVQMVSQTSRGVPGDGPSEYPAISRDGRYVAFQSFASNFILRDNNEVEDIFLKDRVTGSLRLASIGLGGVLANHASELAAVSGAGEWVAFRSFATNLVRGDTNNSSDIFLFDRATSGVQCVSLSNSGEFANGDSQWPVITPDGKWIAFGSFAGNLAPGDTNGYADVFLYDADNRKIELVSRTPDGRSGNGSSGGPSLSDDGRYVVFTSSATDLTPESPLSRAYLYDRTKRRVTAIVVNSSIQNQPVSVFSPTISPTGHWIAFSTPDVLSTAGEADGFGRVYLYDLAQGRLFPVSATRSGLSGLDHSHGASFSADGRFLAFTSWAQTLFAESALPYSQVLLLDRASFQPDALIRHKAPALYRGDGIYDAAVQTFEELATRNTAAIFYAAFHNRGSFPDSFRVTFSSQGMTPTIVDVVEVDSGRNITSEITGGGWNTGLLAEGSRKELRIELRPSEPLASSYTVRIVATSVNDASKSDQFELVLRADQDEDGLPDDWEKRYFTSLDASSGLADSDEDGLSDAREYAAGSDPTNPASRLAIRKITPNGQSQVTVSWASEPNRYYTIEFATSPAGPFLPLAKDLLATPPENGHAVPALGTEGYLRIRADLP